MPKQSADPSKPPRRGNSPAKDILTGVGLLVLGGLCGLWVASMHRLSVRLAVAAVIFVIAGPVLIIRGIINHVRDKSQSG